MVPSSRRLSVALLLVAFLVAAFALGPAPSSATGHPDWDDRATRPYVGSVPVNFTSADLVPLNGLVVMNTLDAAMPRIGGLFCQSLPGETPCTAADRTAVSFCHGVSLRDGENWNSTMDTYVYVGSPYDRLAPGVYCDKPAPATTGVISWWPNPESL